MRTCRLRARLCKQGLVLLEDGDGFIVTNNGSDKRGIYHEFRSLDDVETWLNMLEGRDK